MLHYFAQATPTGGAVCYTATTLDGGAVVVMECMSMALAAREAERRNVAAGQAAQALQREASARSVRRPARWFENDAWAA